MQPVRSGARAARTRGTVWRRGGGRWRPLLAGVLLGLAWPLAVRADGGVVVIVAPSASSPAPIDAEELAAIYRRRQLFMAGQRVQPVNLPTQHPLRRWFSQQVLKQTPEGLEAYWRDQYFNGVVPPFVLASEEAVIRFVVATPGAIGYVSACAVDKRVRVLLLLEGGPACNR